MREILSESHRTQRTPEGQRSLSRYIRHFSSLPNFSNSEIRSIADRTGLGLRALVLNALGIGALLMQEKDDTPKDKHPIEMTTDEAIDYVFAPEIAEQLRREAGKDDPPEVCEPED